jgi:hypothetical protein
MREKAEFNSSIPNPREWIRDGGDPADIKKQ